MSSFFCQVLNLIKKKPVIDYYLGYVASPDNLYTHLSLKPDKTFQHRVPHPQKGGGVLGALLREITKIVGEPEGAAEVVSVYQCGASSPPRQADPSAPPDRPADSTTSCVWVSVKEGEGSFVNSVKLQGLLTLHAGQVSSCVRCAEKHAHARKFTRTHTYTHIKRQTELRRYTLFFFWLLF